MKTSTIIGIVVAIIVVLGGLYWFSMGGGSLGGNMASSTPEGTAGTNGSQNQGNLGQTDNGTPQAPGDLSPTQESWLLSVLSKPGISGYLIANNRMTVYRFANDTENVSNCSGQCLVNWPPVTVASADSAMQAVQPGIEGKVSTIARPDGTIQLTYKGMPLYYYTGDKAEGDTTGQGLNGGLWSTVTP
jgi:predicted lipoprotein with Yx(FWY)xxD motif